MLVWGDGLVWCDVFLLLLLLLLQAFYVGMSRSHSDRLVYIHIGEPLVCTGVHGCVLCVMHAACCLCLVCLPRKSVCDLLGVRGVKLCPQHLQR